MKKNTPRSLRKVGIGLLLGATLPIGALSQEPNYMNIHTVGGSATYSIPLDDIQKITFDETTISLFYKAEEVDALPYETLWKITFSEEPTAIAEVSTTELQIIYRSGSDQLEVTSATPVETLAVYNLQGRLMLQLSPRSESVSLTLADLPAGIYIVRAGNGEQIETQKIIKY